MKTTKGQLMSKVYCVGCGFTTGTKYVVCDGCSLVNNVSVTYVPATCGDDVCYLQANGEINFDGDCSHEKEFDTILSVRY